MKTDRLQGIIFNDSSAKSKAHGYKRIAVQFATITQRIRHIIHPQHTVANYQEFFIEASNKTTADDATHTSLIAADLADRLRIKHPRN